MKFLRVKNLEKHQHYKDRRPPWIKLHSEVLDDYEFACLQDASKAHLMLLWVLASRLDNKIPYDLAWITKQIGANGRVDVEELILQGFIEVFDDGSKLLAPRKQSAMPETETETETRTEKKIPTAVADLQPNWVSRIAAVWGDSVGHVSLGRVGSTLKVAVDRHGVERVERAMRGYVAVQKSDGKTCNIKWFADSAEIWIDRTKEPPAVVDGEMNATLELMTRPAKVVA